MCVASGPVGLPDWAVTLVVVLAVSGFPVALILGWTFDITPAGVRRTDTDLVGAAPAPPGQWRVAGGTAAAVLVLVAGGWWLSTLAFAPAAAIDRLAVLPLTNLMNDQEQEFFVLGMHDALISELAQAGVGVVARTSVMPYRDVSKPASEIARELRVSGLITGSVLRSGDSVRIRVQLIDGRSGDHLWARTFDAELRDVLTL